MYLGKGWEVRRDASRCFVEEGNGGSECAECAPSGFSCLIISLLSRSL